MGKLRANIIRWVFVISPLIIGHFIAWMNHYDLYKRTGDNAAAWLGMFAMILILYFVNIVYNDLYNIEQKYKKLREDRNLFE